MSQHCRANPCCGDQPCSGIPLPQHASGLVSHNKSEQKAKSMIVSFTYKNHRGEEKLRRVDVKALMFERNPGYGYQPGWFLYGICQDRQQPRSFALSHIVLIDNLHTQIISLEASE